MSDTEKLEKRIAQGETRLAEIRKEKTELERAPERAERQLAEAQAEEDRLSADIRAQIHGSSAEDLAAAMRETAALKATLEKMKRETGPKLAKLDEEEIRLRDDLMRTNREIAKARLSGAVMAYQEALKAALPHSEAIKKYAYEAGVMLSRSDDGFDPLLQRGTHVCGGIVIELR